jgi:replicative DNA helicase
MKIPPHSIEAEQATLGAMMITPNCIAPVMRIIKDSDFYNHSHNLVFKAITLLARNDKPIRFLRRLFS